MAATEKPDNQPQFATALRQTDNDNVRILAHARDYEASAMLQVARANNIPVIQDFALSSALRRMPAGTLIPDTVYQAVSLILDFLVHHEKVLDEQLSGPEQQEAKK